MAQSDKNLIYHLLSFTDMSQCGRSEEAQWKGSKLKMWFNQIALGSKNKREMTREALISVCFY